VRHAHWGHSILLYGQQDVSFVYLIGVHDGVLFGLICALTWTSEQKY